MSEVRCQRSDYLSSAGLRLALRTYGQTSASSVELNKYLNTPTHSLSEYPKFGNIPVFSYGQKTTRRDASQREG